MEKWLLYVLIEKDLKVAGGRYSASDQTALQGLSLKRLLPNLCTFHQKMDLNSYPVFDKH